MKLEQILKQQSHLLAPGAQKFTGEKYLAMFRRGVYIMSRGKGKKKEFLYVGKTVYQLIKRAVHSGGLSAKGLDYADALELQPCVNKKAINRLERILIKELQPKYNIQGKK